MTPEEYKALLADLMADPEHAAEKGQLIMEQIEKDHAARTEAEGNVAALTGDLAKARSAYAAAAFLRATPAGAISGQDVSNDERPLSELVKEMAEEIAGKEYVYAK